MATVNEAHLAIALASGDGRQIARIAYLAVLGLTIEASEKLIALAAETESPAEFRALPAVDVVMAKLIDGIVGLIHGPDTKEELTNGG
jgi:hypothetical protein